MPQERRASLTQLKEQLETAEKLVLVTPEMDRLIQIIEQGDKWMQSYKLMIEEPVQLKEIDRFIKYSRTLPINLEQGFDLIENRLKSALSLQLKV